MLKRHLIIPDTQVKRGVPMDHFAWIAQSVLDYKPDTLIHLGDHWDMPSLSRYDPAGSRRMENARYEDDIDFGNAAFERLNKPLKTRYKGKKILLRGNHENRIQRALDLEPKYDGCLGEHHFNDREFGWQVIPYQKVHFEDGLAYTHFFYYPKTGKSIGGTIQNRMNKIGHSFVQGHEQGFLYQPLDFPTGETKHGLVAGSCYLHDEDYKGPQGNGHFRGIVILNEVKDGNYCIMPLTLDYLCRKYENLPLSVFLRRKYPRMVLTLKHQ